MVSLDTLMNICHKLHDSNVSSEAVEWYKAVVLKLDHVSKSRGGIVKMQIARPYLQSLCFRQ